MFFKMYFLGDEFLPYHFTLIQLFLGVCSGSLAILLDGFGTGTKKHGLAAENNLTRLDDVC